MENFKILNLNNSLIKHGIDGEIGVLGRGKVLYLNPACPAPGTKGRLKGTKFSQPHNY